MPHCKKAKKKKIVQNEDEVDNSDDEPEDKIKGQALTCSQSSDSRMATKLRSVVERVFCNLKKNKAMDNLRNTVLGHLGIDLRKAAAFHNYTLKPLIDDKPDTQAVARRLKEQALGNRSNHLDLLFHHNISTRRLFSITNLNNFDDFIPLKRKYLRNKVLCGSFHFIMAKSYMYDFVTISKAYEFKTN